MSATWGAADRDPRAGDALRRRAPRCGVNFTLAERGELRCLIGPNGAGKSTFFKMLTGQFKPTSRAVLFRGKDISRAAA
jgi:ABC-type branched-subunit amino acid transport system ATPase component